MDDLSAKTALDFRVCQRGRAQTEKNRGLPFWWHVFGPRGYGGWGLQGLAWLIEARGLANRSEGLGWLGLLMKVRDRWTGLAQGPSIKVTGLGTWSGPGLVDESEWFGGWADLSCKASLDLTSPGTSRTVAAAQGSLGILFVFLLAGGLRPPRYPRGAGTPPVILGAPPPDPVLLMAAARRPNLIGGGCDSSRLALSGRSWPAEAATAADLKGGVRGGGRSPSRKKVQTFFGCSNLGE